MKLARSLGLFTEETPDLIDETRVAMSAPKNRVIVCTGCQGEPLSALARIVRGEYPRLKLLPGDCVAFSSRIIPGSERQVFHMMSECARQGIEVITARDDGQIHVSGHAYQGDIKRLISATKPKQVLAVHGTFIQLEDHAEFATQNGASIKAQAGEDGVVYHLDQSGLKELSRFDVDWLYIDGFSKTPISSTNLKQRLKIGELGLVIFSGVYDRKRSDWLGEVFLDNKGLELPAHIDPLAWHESCSNKVLHIIENAAYDGIKDAAGLNEAVRIGLRHHYSSIFKKKVVVSASIHQI